METITAVRGVLTIVSVSVGVAFFLAGSIGLLRFPDLFTRLHAVTKADNVGLGFIVLGLAIDAETFRAGLEPFVVWALVLASSSTVSHLIARRARAGGPAGAPRSTGGAG